MNIFDLKRAIRANQFSNVYVFIGLERVGMQTYWERMAECSHRQVQQIDSAQQALTWKQSLLEQPKLFVCYGDKGILSSETTLEHMRVTLGKNALVLTYDTLDKRSRFYKQFESVCVTVDHFTKEVLTYHIQREMALSDTACLALIDACDGDLGRIRLELDKANTLKRFLPDWTADEIIFEMLDRGVIAQCEQDFLFDISNAILHKDSSRAYACVHASETIPPLKLVLVLYNSVRRLLLVQRAKEAGYSDKEITEETGLKSNEIWGISKDVGKRTSEDLERMLNILQKVEQGIKGGILCESEALDYLMINLM